MKSKTTMLSNNNDSSTGGPSNSTHRSGTMTNTIKHDKSSGRLLDGLKQESDNIDETSSMMSLESTIDVSSIDIFSLARHGRFPQLK
jgi:hypothetical protein